MVNQIILGYPTHGKHHSSLYESNHRNEDFTHFSIGKYLVWGTILQGYSLRDTIFSPSIPAGESTKCLNLPI